MQSNNREVVDRESVSVFMQSLSGMLSVKQIKLEKLADAEMEHHIMHTCGAFHKGTMAHIWKIRRLPDGNYSMSRQLVNKAMARSWLVAKLRKQQSLGLALNVKWRTELCGMFFSTGVCSYRLCNFAHALEDLQEVLHHINHKKDKCKLFHETGDCIYGHRCHYLHHANTGMFLNTVFTADEYVAVALKDV